MKPVISLIIPVYNVRQYLKQCIDSALSQTYENLKILIIDDGSTDGSGEICDEYAVVDDRVRVFHFHNCGLSAARNFGLDHMDYKTEYIAFLDSDDWLEQNAIEKAYDSLIDNKADIVTFLYYKEYRNKRIVSAMLEHIKILEDKAILKEYLKNGYIGDGAWNKLYRAELFKNVRYPVGRAFEEVATTYKIIEKSKRVVIIPDKLIHYRIRHNSISHSHNMSNLIDCWLSYREKYDGLYRKIDDSVCKKELVGSCLSAISRMQRWYLSCNRKERQNAKDTINNMKNFVLEHKEDVVNSQEYKLSQKLICISGASTNYLLVGLLLVFNQLYNAIKNEKRFI